MLSAAAGLTFHDLYFRFYEGTIASQQVVEFLQALERQIDRPLLLIWDRLPAHRSWLVQEFLRASQGRIEQVWLPAYAPELNPVEYVWAYWKQHELPNVCPKDYGDLSQTARRTLRGFVCVVANGCFLLSGSRPNCLLTNPILCEYQ